VAVFLNEKTLFLETASMRLRLAEFAEKNDGTDNSPSDLGGPGGTSTLGERALVQPPVGALISPLTVPAIA